MRPRPHRRRAHRRIVRWRSWRSAVHLAAERRRDRRRPARSAGARRAHRSASRCHVTHSPRTLILTQPAPSAGACGVRRLPSKRHPCSSRQSAQLPPARPRMRCARGATAPPPLDAVCWCERGLVASRRARAAAAALRAAACSPHRALTPVPPCAQVPTIGVTSAGAWPNTVRARAADATTPLFCAGAWLRCVARTFVRCSARCAALAALRTNGYAPLCSGADRRGRGGAHSMARPHPGFADSRERLRDHVCNHTVRWRGGEASAAAHAACAEV